MADTLTHRRVLKIAVPIVISNATVPILGAVDTGVVGQMGLAAPIGAVGIGAIILSALYWVFGFLRMGTTGLAAQALGRREDDEFTAILQRALLIGLGAGVVIALLHPILFALAFMVSPASPQVEGMARDYMILRLLSAPAAIALYGINGWLIAAERTRAVLIIQLVMNLMNIVLDLWFVLGLGWGVEGVAIATVLSEWAGFGIGIWLCMRGAGAILRPDWSRILNRARLAHMAMVNGDILLRSLLLQAIFVSFLFYGARFGDTTLAANQVLLQFLNITAYALDGFAFAAEALVGQALGARHVGQLRRSVWLSSLWGAGAVLVLAVLFALFGPAVIDLMTTAPDVRAEARHYLIYMIFAPVTGVAAWMLDGVFIGATRTADMRNMMAVSFVIYAASLALLLPAFENHGLWIALHISFIARGLTLALRYPALERSAL